MPFSSGRNDSVSNERIIHSQNIFWFDGMQHIPKQSHNVRCPALELLCNSFCDPLTKMSGDPLHELFSAEHSAQNRTTCQNDQNKPEIWCAISTSLFRGQCSTTENKLNISKHWMPLIDQMTCALCFKPWNDKHLQRRTHASLRC